MKAPGWVRTHGGTHYCDECRRFSEASQEHPFWLYWESETTATASLCNRCAERLTKAA